MGKKGSQGKQLREGACLLGIALGGGGGGGVSGSSRVCYPCDSFFSPSVPRFPYQVCLLSSRRRPSLSAWKPCSATSGSCSILLGPERWPPLSKSPKGQAGRGEGSAGPAPSLPTPEPPCTGISVPWSCQGLCLSAGPAPASPASASPCRARVRACACAPVGREGGS